MVIDPEDKIRQELRELNNAMAWRAIARLPQYQGIPHGTLDSYSKGRPIVNEHHRLILGLTALERVPVCPIHRVAHYTVHKRNRRVKVITRWRDLPTVELLAALVNREEY